ncbi:MAG: hypothetical protein IKP12_01845 [Acholeplasmatales bacterium]|nr:hypothetical protein [Acholeplasmatales bacterium]
MGKYNFNEGYLYNDSFSEKEFKDAVLKYIMDDYMSPSYIFDEIKLSEVGRINIPLIQSTGRADIEYFRQIGYDTIETTTKYKTTTYSNGFQNKTQSSSSRTITNWQNDSGTLEGIAQSGYYDEKYKIYDEYVANHVMDKKNISLLSNDDLKNYPLTDDIIDFLKNDTINKVFQEKITYPTNKVRNEKYNGEATLTNISCTIVSLYVINVSVRDKEIYFIVCSNGDIEIKMFGDYPSDNYDSVLKFNREVSEERKEATKKERTITRWTIISTIILFLLLLILGLSQKIIALTIISFVVLVIGLIIYSKYKLTIKKISKPYYERIAEHNKKDSAEKNRIKEEGYESFRRKNKLE